MKKILLLVTLIVFMAQIAFAADCTQTVTNYGNYKATVTFVCTADSGGTFTATTTSAANTDFISGKYLERVLTIPGATNPTAAWAATIKDANSFDIMGGTLAGRSATLAESAIPLIGAAYSPVLLVGTHTLAITGNVVNGAIITVILYLSR